LPIAFAGVQKSELDVEPSSEIHRLGWVKTARLENFADASSDKLRAFQLGQLHCQRCLSRSMRAAQSYVHTRLLTQEELQSKLEKPD